MEETAVEMLTKIVYRITGVDVKAVRTTQNDPNSKLGNYTFYRIGDGHLACFNKKDMVIASDVETLVREMEGVSSRLYLVTLYAPSSNTLKAVRKHSEKLHCFHIRELQFDITTHELFVPHRVLTQEEEKTFVEKYHIVDVAKQLPWIDSHDPGAKWIGAVPGNVLEISRHSDTVGKSLYYRYCVHDVDVVTA